jgi:hypothetical protein
MKYPVKLLSLKNGKNYKMSVETLADVFVKNGLEIPLTLREKAEKIYWVGRERERGCCAIDRVYFGGGQKHESAIQKLMDEISNGERSC